MSALSPQKPTKWYLLRPCKYLHMGCELLRVIITQKPSDVFRMKIAKSAVVSSYFYLITSIKSKKSNQRCHQQWMRTHTTPAVTPLPLRISEISVGSHFTMWAISSPAAAKAPLCHCYRRAESQRVSPSTGYFFSCSGYLQVPFADQTVLIQELKPTRERQLNTSLHTVSLPIFIRALFELSSTLQIFAFLRRGAVLSSVWIRTESITK